ncbi:MAG: hypothetical protein M3014_15625 [Chloroflexota bacterium]|nr:hypothetical protein [Chloroflexota bacterium]
MNPELISPDRHISTGWRLLLILAVVLTALGGAAVGQPISASAAPSHSALRAVAFAPADPPTPAPSAVSTGRFRYFPETGHFLRGPFLSFWESHGATPVFGLPLTEPLVENGLAVQYLERARIEWHPEISTNPSSQVLLTRLGAILAESQGKTFSPVEGGGSTPTSHFFSETGHIVSNAFLTYWLNNGGLAVFGYPISEEIVETNAMDGKQYSVQYFERNRFEWHPELGPRYNVQLGLLGAEYAQSIGLNPLARVLLPSPLPSADQDLSDSPQLAKLVDSDLLPAIKALGHTPQFRWVPAVLVQYKVAVEFSDINGEGVAGAFVATYSKTRPYVIVVPQAERGRSVEALASVLAHEATHAYDAASGVIQVRSNCSVQEETRAYMNGLAAWVLLKGKDALFDQIGKDTFERDLIQSLRGFNNDDPQIGLDFSVQNGSAFIHDLYGSSCGK